MHKMRKFWLALSKSGGVSSGIVLKLISHFGSPDKLFQASFRELSEVPEVDLFEVGKLVNALRQINPDAEFNSLQGKDIRFITFDDDEYPENLRHISAPPLVLYLKGSMVPGDKLSIAIVGARKATAYGKMVAFSLARDLARHGVTVVSGLARGIDTSAHKGAIEGEGRTISVLGCGIDIVYPPENRLLKKKIEAQGATITEYPPGTPPLKHHFPMRNRIIAGMTLGTIVVEAGLKSGALITADSAMRSGREVFAVPGAVTSELSRGPHSLIKDGARLVEGIDDIVAELRLEPVRQKEKKIPLSAEEEKIMQCVTTGAKPVSQIVEELEMGPEIVMAQLSLMELKGLIRKGPGNSYVKSLE